ncbi:MAG: mannose-1-phosphate guanylyltransferase [Chloroflexota bacterium]
MDNYYAMIMAGGGGTRLWPLSRSKTPKQMIPLVEDASMFKVTVDRLPPLFSPDRIYVVTGRDYVERLREEAPSIPPGNFIVEPSARNTAPAAALGISVIQQRDPSAVIAILTADHHIADKPKFRDVLAAAFEIAQSQDFIVTLGISPSYPATGFGYIKRGNYLGDVKDFNYYHSLGFREKPDAKTAIQYLRSGSYSWNSGMFIWTAAHAMGEFERQQPDMHTQLETLRPTINTPAYEETLEEVWPKLPKIAIDYAVMENAENMCVIPMDVGWSDVGSWGALYDILDKDDNNNAYKGNTKENRVNIDTQESLVYSDRMVVTVGVRDIVVIDTDDALLICHRDRTQEVKDVVRALKDQRQHRYL